MVAMSSLYKRGNRHWVSYTDHAGKRRRLPIGPSLKVARVFRVHLDHLDECAKTGASPDMPTVQWLGMQAPKVLEKLTGLGLITPKSLIQQETLAEQLIRWERAIADRGRTPKYAKRRADTAGHLLAATGAEYFADIDAEAVVSKVAEWRRDNAHPMRTGLGDTRDVSEATLAFYLSAAKGFCRWMKRAKYAADDPLSGVTIHKSPARKNLDRPSPAAVRRALNLGEQQALVTGTPALPHFRGVSGPSRALLYRVALQTGLRPGHILTVKPGDLRDEDHGDYTITPTARAYNKRCTPKLLQAGLYRDLVAHAEDRPTDEPLLDAPRKDAMAKMVRRDCEALGIDTHGVDFYCLRHSFASVHVANGVHPKQLADLLDDSVEMVMKYYSHSFTGDLRRAVEMMPDFGVEAPQRKDVGYGA